MPHQVDYGLAVKIGLNRCGIPARVSHNTETIADIHVCIGPNYALNRWRQANTLLLDRAYWGDPERVSIHWLKGGERVWCDEYPGEREHPDLQPARRGRKKIYFCDFNERPPVRGYDTVRLHPANGKDGESFNDALERHAVAVGKRSTALVAAAIAGLKVQTDDPGSLVYPLCNGMSREEWINRLAWHNWSLKEIERGEFLDAIGNDITAD